MSTVESLKPQRKPRLTILVIVLMFCVLTGLVFAGRVWAKRSGFAFIKISNTHDRPIVQNQTPSSTQPARESNQAPPGNVPDQTGGTLSASASESWINFDYFPNGTAVPSGTRITNQYPPAVFSTDPSHYCVALSGQNYGSSLPNRLTRG